MGRRTEVGLAGVERGFGVGTVRQWGRLSSLEGPIAQLVERLAGSHKGSSGVRLPVSVRTSLSGTTKVMCCRNRGRWRAANRPRNIAVKGEVWSRTRS